MKEEARLLETALWLEQLLAFRAGTRANSAEMTAIASKMKFSRCRPE